jgi:hypothetical protein
VIGEAFFSFRLSIFRSPFLHFFFIMFFRLLDQLHEAVINNQNTPYEKHVDVLLKSSAICRQMAGIVCILCKSGKEILLSRTIHFF